MSRNMLVGIDLGAFGGYDDPMEPSLTKENRQRLFALAEKNGWKKKDIGVAIGTSSDNVARIIERNSENSRFIGALDAWLTEHAPLKPEDFRRALSAKEQSADYSVKNVLTHTGEKLIGLGEMLLNPNISLAFKTREYEAFILTAHAQLKMFTAETQKLGE